MGEPPHTSYRDLVWRQRLALHRGPFVHSHDLSYHDLLLEQSSVQLVKAVPRRQHTGHKEMIH